MKKYNSYKPSGVEWIGDIPENWNVGSWRYYFSSGMGQTILKENLIEDGILPVFSATESYKYFGFVNESNLILDVDDIVIPARGNSIGFVKIVKEKSTTTQTTIYSKKKNKKINSHYIYFYCVGHKKSLFPFVQTAIPQITVEEINSNKILIPPLQEQEQIVNYLDEKTTIIDKLISTKLRKLELLKEQRTTLINQVITKGLNTKVKMKDSGVEWIGEIPENWVIKKMKYCLKMISDKKEVSKEDIKISPENVENGTGVCFNLYSEYTGDGMKFIKGDILLNKLRIYLKKILITENEGFSMGEMIVLRTIDGINKYYYYTLFNQGLIDLLNNQSTGVKLPRVSPDIILNSEILYPPIEEQKKIVEYIDIHTKEIDDLVSMEQNKIQLLKEYKQSLISEVITGKIKVV